MNAPHRHPATELKGPRARRRSPRLRLLALLPAFAAACETDEQTGIPLPDPLPLVSAMRASGAPPGAVQTHVVVGLPGAVAGAGRVQLAGQHGTFAVQSTAAGTFYAAIEAAGGEQLAVRYASSAAAMLTLAPLHCPPQIGCAATAPPQPIEGTPPIDAPSGGQTTIRGRLFGPGTIVAVNSSAGDVFAASTDAAGLFTVALPARSGDGVLVYADAKPLGEGWRLTVP